MVTKEELCRLKEARDVSHDAFPTAWRQWENSACTYEETDMKLAGLKQPLIRASRVFLGAAEAASASVLTTKGGAGMNKKIEDARNSPESIAYWLKKAEIRSAQKKRVAQKKARKKQKEKRIGKGS